MILTLYVKKRETKDGKKFNSFSARRAGKWYSVRFVKECQPPQAISLDEHGNVKRAFIGLTTESKFDIKDGEKGATLFIEGYDVIGGDDLARVIAAEKKAYDDYKAADAQRRIDFVAPVDSEDLPF